jgi:hypothetical protein
MPGSSQRPELDFVRHSAKSRPVPHRSKPRSPAARRASAEVGFGTIALAFAALTMAALVHFVH